MVRIRSIPGKGGGGATTPNKTVSALKICPTGAYGQRMDLEVLKALGDETRYALYRELAVSTAPRSAGELADALDLHANTVRLHLERLKDAGVVDVEVIHRGTVGRPQHRYSLAPGAPGLGLDPPAHVLLAGLLAALAETAGADATAARSAGRAWGRQSAVRTTTRSPQPSRGCLNALAQELDRLGFEPAVDSDPEAVGAGTDGGAGTRIEFLHCPFRELAEAYPELVCNLHRGICEGVAEAGRGTVEQFSTLYEPDPCHVVVAVP
jgi:predicted ArsR family transcriptional regulator